MSPTDDDKSDSDGFLSAWSRRKLAARRAQAEDRADHDEPEAIDPHAAADEPLVAQDPPSAPHDDEVDDDFIASLPSIDDITAHTELAPFMRRGVPLALRNSALRKVWMLNPLIRDHVDPALDYAWDWNAPGGVPGGGGTLTGDGVAQMVKKLLGDEKQAESPDDDDRQAPSDVVDAGDVPPGDADMVTASPVRQSAAADRDRPAEESADANSAVGDDEPAKQERVNLTLATLRRHGGALPE